MSNLTIQATKSTPSVDFNADTGVLCLSGASYPENAYAFYKPVLDWLKEYTDRVHPSMELRIDLKYLNTSSTKCLMNIVRHLELGAGRGARVKIDWFYDSGNDTILEVAEEFKIGLALEFNIRQK